MRILGRQTIETSIFDCDYCKNVKLNLVNVKAEMNYNENFYYKEFQCPQCKKSFQATFEMDDDLKTICYPVAFARRKVKF